MRTRRAKIGLNGAAAVIALLAAAPALANPADGTVSAGSATITAPAPGVLTVDQHTKIVIIDWKSFNIGPGETTRFNQPGSDAMAVNRIGGGDPAKILGNLTANGKVVLIDGNGILFGKNARVNVGGLLATTADASNEAILSGKANFSADPGSRARIVNRGEINAESGMVGLVAPSVVNSGVIRARMGQVTLGAARVFTVDFQGDGLIAFPVDPGLVADAVDENGRPVRAMVVNNGRIEGQTVLLSARTAAQLVTNVISVKGEIVARSVSEQGGHIILDGGTGGIALAGARLDAGGEKGGGSITIGAETAGAVTADAATLLDVSAGDIGDGGAIYINSADTRFAGTAHARGGARGGNGGTIETSGHLLNIDDAVVDTSAAQGRTGDWLLDPFNVTISTTATSSGSLTSNIFTPTANNSVLNVTTLTNALASNNVIVTTGTSGSQAGTLTVSASLSWNSARTLTLKSAGAMAINANITATNGGLYLYAGTRGYDANFNVVGAPANITATGSILVDTFTLGQGNWSQIATSLPIFSAKTFTFDFSTSNAAIGAGFYAWSQASDNNLGSGSFLRAKAGNGTAGSPYQIADIYGLAGIGFSQTTMRGKNYKIVNNIDATNLRDFIPIGSDNLPDYFDGVLDGQNFTISNLTSTGAYSGFAGLFGNGMSGTVKDLTLTKATIGSANALFAGAVAAQLGNPGNGTISNVSVIGGTVQAQSGVGGLVGQFAQGTISGSKAVNLEVTTAAGASTANAALAAGGLVGHMANGTITQSYASGSVVGLRSAGGAVGYMSGGTISRSFSTSTVKLFVDGTSFGANFSAGAGGFAGVVASGATITQSYALGSVFAANSNTATVFAGGFAGANGGSIREAYAAGFTAFAGAVTIGGFAGSTSARNAGTTVTGTLTSTVFDSDTSGQAGGSTTAALQGALPSGFNTLASGIWATGPGLYPYLASFGAPQKISGIAYKNAAKTQPAASSNAGLVPVTLTLNGSNQGSVTAGANGYYYVQLPAGTLASTPIVTATSANATTGAVTATASITASGSVSGLDIAPPPPTISGTVWDSYGGGRVSNATVREMPLTGGAVVASATSSAIGAYSLLAPADNGDVLLFLDSGNGVLANTIVSFAGISITGADLYGGYLHFYNSSAVTVSALLSKLSGFTAPGGVPAGNFLFSGTTFTSNLAVTSDLTSGLTADTALSMGGRSLLLRTTAGDLNITGTITTFNGDLTLESFRDLNIKSTVTRSAYGITTLKSGSGGSGDYGFFEAGSLNFTAPDIPDAQRLIINDNIYTLDYSLASMAAHSGVSGYYALAQSLNAGNQPLNTTGVIVSALTGSTYTGLGHTITRLTLNSNAGAASAGLFGTVTNSTLRDIGLVDGSVSTSGTYAGALAGTLSNSTLGNVFAYKFNVNGSNAGGLVGTMTNGSRIFNAYASGANVTGGSFSGRAGGLVGMASGGSITNAYSLNGVSGGSGGSGGLLGSALDGLALESVYAAGRVTGPFNQSGGLVGVNTDNSLSQSYAYWDIGITGQSLSAGFGAIGLSTVRFGLPNGFSDKIWYLGQDSFPLLHLYIPPPETRSVSGTVYADYGVTPLGGANVKEVRLGGGAVISSAISGGNGFYSLTGPSTGATLLLFLDNSSGKFANTIVSFDASSNLSGVNLYAGYLHFINYSSVSVSSVLSQLSSFVAPSGGFPSGDFLFSGTTPSASLAITSTGGITLDRVLNLGSNTLALRAGGAVTQSQGITAGKLLLLGSATSFTLSSSANAIGTVAANSGAVSLANAIALAIDTVESVKGITSTGAVTVSSTGSLSIVAGAKVTGGAGATIALAAGSVFVNGQGSDAVAAGAGGRWLIYSADPAGNVFGGLNSGNTAIWNATVTSLAPGSVGAGGNRYLFASQPLLTVTTGNATKVYGQDGASAIAGAYSITGFNAGLNGIFLADTAATAFSGAPSLGSAGAAVTASVPGGPYAITAAQGTLQSSAGYGFSFVNTGNLTVTPKTLTASLTGSVSKVYDGSTAATLAAGNYSLAGIVGADVVALNGPTAGAFDSKNAGAGKTVTVTGLSLSGAAAGNYTLSASAIAGTIGTITAKALTASLTGSVGRIYDGTSSATLAVDNYALTGAVAGDTVGLATLPAAGAFDSRNVGTGKTVTSAAGITLAGADAGNYTVASTASGAIGQITQKALTVDLANTVISKTYDATLSASLTAANFVLGGVAGGDIVSVATSSGSFDTRNVGAGKTVSVAGITLGGADAANYYLPATSASRAVGAITAATVTATLSGNVEKIFDGTDSAVVAASNLGLAGVLGSDVVTVSTGTSASYDTANAGSNKTVTVAGLAISGGDAGNYVLASNSVSAAVGKIDPGTLIVIAAQLTGSVNKTYDGTTAATLTAGNYLIQGLAPGATDVQLNNPTTGTYDNANAGSGKTVTVTGLAIAGGADAINYTLPVTTITGAIGTISAKTVTAGFNGVISKVYDGTDSASLIADSFVLTGVVGADAVALNAVSGLYDGKDAGAGKVITVTGLSLTGAAAGNYVLAANSLAGAAGAVTPRTLTASLTGPVQKVYDGTNAAPVTATNLSLAGVISGDIATLTLPAAASFDSTSAGTGKVVNVTGLGLAGAQAGNYALAAADIAGMVGTIDKKLVTASLAGPVNKTYDGTTSASLVAANFMLNGAVGGDAVGIAAVSGDFGDAGAGTGKTVSVSGLTLAGNDAGNYLLTGNAASGAVGVITAKTLTYSVANATSTYGTLAIPGAASLIGVLAQDAASVAGTVGVFDGGNGAVTLTATTNAGSYVEKVTGLSGTAAANYVLAGAGNTNGTLTINPLVVAPTTLTYGVADATGVYGTLATLGAVTLNGVLAPDIANVSGIVGLFDASNAQKTLSATLAAGSYSERVTSLGGTAAGNYVLSSIGNFTGTLTILPKTLTATLTGTVNKVYDGTATAALAGNNYLLSGIVGGDAVTLNNPASGLFDTGGAGTGKTVSVTDLALSGSGAGNYVLAATSISDAIGIITPKVLTPSLTGNAGKTYDGTAAAALTAGNYSLAGVIAGNTVLLNNPSSGTFDSRNAGTGKTVSVSGLAISGADAGNYTLGATTIAGAIGAITPKTLTASLTGSVSKVYDGTVAATLTAGNYDLAGVVSGDTVTLNAPASGSFDTRDSGAGKTVAVSGLAIGGADAGNYSLGATSIADAIGTISQKILVTSLAGTVTKTYDGTAAAELSAGNYSLDGVVAGDSVTVTTTSGTYDNANAGTGKIVSVTDLALSGDTANYVLSSLSVAGAVGVVNQAPLTIKVNDASRQEGYPNPDITFVLQGLLGDDTASVLSGVVLSTLANITSPVGAYVVNSSGGAAGNYAVTVRIGGTLTILPRPANPELPGLNNALPASDTNYNGNPAGSGTTSHDPGDTAGITGASGSLICDVSNDDANTQTCRTGGPQATNAKPGKTAAGRLARKVRAAMTRARRRAA